MSHGKERRRRFVYVTRNTEYHCFDDVCVAVRDRRSGSFVDSHSALARRLEGGVRLIAGGAVPTLRGPEVGSPMYFGERRRDEGEVITSRLEAVDRPAIADLALYPKTA
ncbi:MAG: hypothetical protein KC731_04875 [Myxococcales bacterium]|nr:hypothetical protein [Myxococcales bacterium]